MASLIHHLSEGIILKCSVCTSPIRRSYVTHMCEYNNRRILNGIPVKIYCFDCVTHCGDCKYCKLSYLAKFNFSL